MATALKDVASPFTQCQLYAGLTSVLVKAGAAEEQVALGPDGPMVMHLDGSTAHLQTVRGIAGGGQVGEKLWSQMTSTEQTIALHISAKKNRYMQERLSDPTPEEKEAAQRYGRRG
eukprot:TRINITY_DN94053_c0_g1_i1.p1 TRINITY_DN94053_c0_g1~~TRINITY_DN94053_c0_g1_i1.p1  ORF type:complete len:116 (-),score=27.69 TRINITY_DN94053_c0_g1_i1:69-416(-)